MKQPPISNENYLKPIEEFIDPCLPDETKYENKKLYLVKLKKSLDLYLKSVQDEIDKAIKVIKEKHSSIIFSHKMAIKRIASEIFLYENTETLKDKNEKLPSNCYDFSCVKPEILEDS